MQSTCSLSLFWEQFLCVCVYLKPQFGLLFEKVAWGYVLP